MKSIGENVLISAHPLEIFQNSMYIDKWKKCLGEKICDKASIVQC